MMAPFITTYTGRKVNPLDLRPEDISILDIAHHLACLNRFVGALKNPISIAQHSVYVAILLDGTKWEREGLFHDADEAYLGDMSKWVKQDPKMVTYREAGRQAWFSISTALNLDVLGIPETCPEIKKADDLMVRYECLREMRVPDHMFELSTHPRPTDEEIKRVGYWRPWSWEKAEYEFLNYARILKFEV